MAKPRKRQRYPAKFRATLEKIAEGREAREQAASKPEAGFPSSCWHEFLGPGTVHTVHARMNDDQTGMTTVYTMDPLRRPDMVMVDAPPWAGAPDTTAKAA